MKLEIENRKLAGVIGVLDKLELKGLQSIHRTRLAKQLIEKLQQVADEEKKLKDSYAKKDDDGNPIVKEGKYQFDDGELEKLETDLKDFYEEKTVIESGDNPSYLESVKKSLEESEIEWQGKEAYDYAYLYESFIGDDEE